MIDTVVFKLHDLSHEGHKAIMDFLLDEGAMDKNQWHNITSKVFVDKEEYMGKTNKIRMNEYASHAFDSMKRVRSKIYGGFPAPSYHYDILWFEMVDCIQFQVSIPKYLFGHNIAQFVPSPDHKLFTKHGYGKMKDVEFQARIAYGRMLAFIKRFFEENFIDIPVDYEKIELRRFDICFNQYFNSKDDALRYLELQKRVVKNYVREGSSYGQHEWTSCNYQTAFYGLKIYHKGSEFRKHDKKRLMDYNKQIAEGLTAGLKKNKWAISSFDVEYLQDNADRILRYELSIDTKGMSYFFKRYVFKKDDPDWRNMMKDFNYWKNIIENPLPESDEEYRARDEQWRKLEKRLEKAKAKGLDHKRILIERQMELYKAERSGNRRLVTKDAMILYKDMQRFLGKRHEFYPFRKVINKKEIGNFHSYRFQHVKKQAFSRKLFMHVFGRLWSDFNAFQIKQMPTLDEMMDALRTHNMEVQMKQERFKDLRAKGLLTNDDKKRIGTVIRESKMISLFMLLRTKTIDEIAREKIFPRTTMFRYRQDLAKIQVYRNNVGIDNIPHCDDYEEYYNNLLHGEWYKFFSHSSMMRF